MNPDFSYILLLCSTPQLLQVRGDMPWKMIFAGAPQPTTTTLLLVNIP